MTPDRRTGTEEPVAPRVRRGRHRLPRRRLGAGLLAGAALAIGGGVTVAALGSDPAPAHADALCDQMRAQYGSNWPCISVPTNTFQPTTNTPAPTTGANGAGSGGPQVGSNIGPGPGEGNGTPIVTVPGQTVPQPPAVGDGNGGSGPANPNTGGTQPTAPQPGPTGDDAGALTPDFGHRVGFMLRVEV